MSKSISVKKEAEITMTGVDITQEWLSGAEWRVNSHTKLGSAYKLDCGYEWGCMKVWI